MSEVKHDGIHWKAVQRQFEPESAFFIAGDMACTCTSHKFTCIVSLDDSLSHSSSDSKSISCDQPGCNKTFHSLISYEMHYNTQHRYVCSICRRCFPIQHLLDLHVLECHDALFQLQSLSVDMYQCLVESCSIRFKTFSERANHMVTVHKYPAVFRFFTSKPPPAVINRGSSPSTMDTEDIHETDIADVQAARTFTHRVPKSICFGHGSTRGFRGRPRRSQTGRQPHC